MCGHATLACMYVIFRFYEADWDSVDFLTKSGKLTVRSAPGGSMEGERSCLRPGGCVAGFGSVAGLAKVKSLDGLLLHLTARGTEYDCVSRSFAPKLNVAEDPVCGSGHCHIVPYWRQILGKEKITAYQASARSGILYCRMEGDRVVLGGKAALYAISDICVK